MRLSSGLKWFLEQQFLQRMRRVDLDTTLRAQRVALIPAPGVHWFWYGGRPFQVWFSRSDNTHERSARRIESLTFRTLGRKQAFLKSFVDDVVRCHLKRLGVQSWLFTSNDGWDHAAGYEPRLLDSVVLPPGEKEHLVQDIANFRRSKQRYSRLGVPYHRGYLLYGPPGTGKTSLVSALAANFGMSVYFLNLADFNDRSLMSAVNQIPANSVLLFEDIDCMKSGQARPSANAQSAVSVEDRTQKENVSIPNGVTLSGLLNVLDGFFAPVGVLFMMTTNRIESLDPALLRPGRIDYRLYLGKASEQQKTELYWRFFPGASEAEAREIVRTCLSAETMAEFQGLLLGMTENPAGIQASDRLATRKIREKEELEPVSLAK